MVKTSGKMKLLLSRVLLSSLCALSSWTVSLEKLVVTQSPDVFVMEGDTANITCCWRGEVQKMKVSWLKNQTELKNDFLNLKTQSMSNCLNLMFSNITREDSGRYVCRVTVEIPVYTVINGSTFITVTDRENTAAGASASSRVLIHVLRSLSLLALLLSLFFFSNRRAKCQQHGAAAPKAQGEREDYEEEGGDEAETGAE